MAPNAKYPSFLGLLSRVTNPLPPPRVPLTTAHPLQQGRADWATRGGGHILGLENRSQKMGILHIKEEMSIKKIVPKM